MSNNHDHNTSIQVIVIQQTQSIVTLLLATRILTKKHREAKIEANLNELEQIF